MENHGLQCGYCTPGMIMAATSLLDEQPHPSEADVRIGLEGNLCRCTGYHNIVKAVLAAAEARRLIVSTTETAPRTTTVIGQRLTRKEDPALLTGEARFTADLDVPGALYLAVVRSPYAHARITSVDTSRAAGAEGVVAVYTGADLADAWAAPMPCAWPVTDDMKNPAHFPLATDKACYVGDGVAAVLATSESAARDAVDLVDVDVRAARSGDRPRGRAVRSRRHPRGPRHQPQLHVVAQGRGQRRPDRRRLRRRRPHRQGALRPAAPDPDGDGDPGRRRRAPTVRRRRHALLDDADPAHPQDHVGDHARPRRAPGARRRPGRRRWLRLEAQRLRRGAAVHGARQASTACPCAGTRHAPRTRWRRSTAAARSRTSSSPPTPTAS